MLYRAEFHIQLVGRPAGLGARKRGSRCVAQISPDCVLIDIHIPRAARGAQRACQARKCLWHAFIVLVNTYCCSEYFRLRCLYFILSLLQVLRLPVPGIFSRWLPFVSGVIASQESRGLTSDCGDVRPSCTVTSCRHHADLTSIAVVRWERPSWPSLRGRQ